MAVPVIHFIISTWFSIIRVESLASIAHRSLPVSGGTELFHDTKEPCHQIEGAGIGQDDHGNGDDEIDFA